MIARQGGSLVKYCVLCRAEYMDGIAICASCRAPLVRSLDSQEALANPSRLLWIGNETDEFEVVACAIRDAELPALVEERPAGMLGGLVRSGSQIHVLSADFDQALSAAASAIQLGGRVYSHKQACHSCARQCPAFLAACPYCKAVLIVEQKQAQESTASTPPPQQSAMKYCPLCDAEYSQAHTSCTVCGVELVPEELRGRPLDERQRKERIELVWRGGDPGAVSEVIHVLRDAGIRHHVQPTNDHFVFELGMPRPKYVVRTFASDAARAKELLTGIHEASPFVSMEASALALAAEPIERKPFRRHDWKPAAATLEIWSGEDAALAQLLQDCFRENDIGVRCEGKPPGIMRLMVMPSDEASAREIIREVTEATPPA
jgi:hypothetical protein